MSLPRKKYHEIQPRVKYLIDQDRGPRANTKGKKNWTIDFAFLGCFYFCIFYLNKGDPFLNKFRLLKKQFDNEIDL